MNLSYNAEIMAVPLPPKFKVPLVEMYDGSKDPGELLETFKAHMTLHRFSNEIVCWGFPLTLKGAASGWFEAPQPGSIESFEELGRQFLTQFMASRRRRRLVAYLLIVKQLKDESLKTYLACFKK